MGMGEPWGDRRVAEAKGWTIGHSVGGNQIWVGSSDKYGRPFYVVSGPDLVGGPRDWYPETKAEQAWGLALEMWDDANNHGHVAERGNERKKIGAIWMLCMDARDFSPLCDIYVRKVWASCQMRPGKS